MQLSQVTPCAENDCWLNAMRLNDYLGRSITLWPQEDLFAFQWRVYVKDNDKNRGSRVTMTLCLNHDKEMHEDWVMIAREEVRISELTDRYFDSVEH